MLTFTINGTAGVVNADDPRGQVQVDRGEGDTLVKLTAVGADGRPATVFLDASQALTVMAAIGACSVDL